MRIRNILKLIDNHPVVFLNTSDKTMRIGLGASAAAKDDTRPKIYVIQFLKGLKLKNKMLPPKYAYFLKLLFQLKNSADNLIPNSYVLNIINGSSQSQEDQKTTATRTRRS